MHQKMYAQFSKINKFLSIHATFSYKKFALNLDTKILKHLIYRFRSLLLSHFNLNIYRSL